MKVTDEMLEKALDVLMDDGHNGLDCRPTRNFTESVRAALDAAIRDRPQPDRERIAEVLREAGEVHPTPILPGWFVHATHSLLASGVLS